MRVCLAVCAAFLAVMLTAPQAARADESRTLTHQGVERRYELHLPPNHADKSLPLVLSLHGRGQSLESVRNWLRLEPVAAREGFAIAYPEALELKWSYGRPVMQPMPQAGGEPADDTGFIAAMLDELVAGGIADPQRIYVAGVSRGGLMSFTLTCAMGERIAAVAATITGMTEHQRADCRPARPMPMLVLAGTADRVQSYDGWILARGRVLSVPETLEYWRTVNGCTGQRAQPLPDADPEDGSAIGVVTWTGCKPDAPLVFYRVWGGGHTLPSLAPPSPYSLGRLGRRNRDIETAELVWDFFKGKELGR